MKQKYIFKLEINVEIPEDHNEEGLEISRGAVIENICEMIEEDGIREYINEDNLVEVKE